MEIYVMDVDGKNQRRLTNNHHDDWDPSWSPDGKRIVFTSERDGNREIYVMDAHGRKPKNLLKITMMTGIPHGPLMASALSLLLEDKNTKST